MGRLPGPPGPPGPAAPTDYAYFFSTETEVVDPNEGITYDNNGVIRGGISHAMNSSEIFVTTPGDYSVEYIMSTELFQNLSFALFLNDDQVPGSNYSSTSGGIDLPGQVIVRIPAGVNVLELRNVGDETVTLSSTNPNEVSASFKIIRLG